MAFILLFSTESHILCPFVYTFCITGETDINSRIYLTSFHLHPYFVFESSYGSGESVPEGVLKEAFAHTL